MKNEEERKMEFLIGLAKLTRETGIAIGGSESIYALKPEELDERAGYGYRYEDEVSWISPSDSYNWERFAYSIVRGA